MSKLGITCNGMTWNSMGVSNKSYSGESVHLLPTISMISYDHLPNKYGW